MNAAPGAERLAMAQSEVTRACGLLIAPAPETLHGCEDALRLAVSALTEFQAQCRQGTAEAESKSAVRSLQAEVRRAGLLLQNLAGFYRGWERILGAMSGGYTARGDPAPVARLGQLNCHG